MFHSFYVYCLEFFCGEELLLLSNLFIHSLIYFYQYGCIHIYSMGYNPIQSLICCSNCFNFGHWDSLSLGPVSFGHGLIFWWTLSYFLAPQDILFSSCIFSAPELESATSPRSPTSFDLEIPKQFEFYHNLFKIEI